MNLIPQVSQTSAKLAFSDSNPYPGMNRVDIGDFGGADHGWNIQIALGELRRSNTDRLVGKSYCEGIPVCLAVDSDRANSQLLACANNAQRDFPAIRDQYLFKHAN